MPCLARRTRGEAWARPGAGLRRSQSAIFHAGPILSCFEPTPVFLEKGTMFRPLKYTVFKLLHNSALHAETRETPLIQQIALKLK
jgi:hypothetical protein